MAKLVARMLAKAKAALYMGLNPVISQIHIQNGRHKQRLGEHTVARQKNIQNMYFTSYHSLKLLQFYIQIK